MQEDVIFSRNNQNICACDEDKRTLECEKTNKRSFVRIYSKSIFSGSSHLRFYFFMDGLTFEL